MNSSPKSLEEDPHDLTGFSKFCGIIGFVILYFAFLIALGGVITHLPKFVAYAASSTVESAGWVAGETSKAWSDGYNKGRR